MPHYQFSERHSLRASSPDEALWQALKSVTPGDVGPIRWLMAIRGLPAKLAGRKKRLFAPETPILSGSPSGSPNFIVLEEAAPNEIVIGMAGQFWKLDGGPPSGIRTAAGFEEFRKPDHIPVTVNFEIGAGLISTETRIEALDESARRKFGLYWTLIRLGSGWIRIAWLRAIQRRAAA
jgi:hypothetical protein